MYPGLILVLAKESKVRVIITDTGRQLELAHLEDVEDIGLQQVIGKILYRATHPTEDYSRIIDKTFSDQSLVITPAYSEHSEASVATQVTEVLLNSMPNLLFNLDDSTGSFIVQGLQDTGSGLTQAP